MNDMISSKVCPAEPEACARCERDERRCKPTPASDADAALLASRQGETTNVGEIADEWMSHYYFSDVPTDGEYADRENVHAHLCELIRKVSQINSRKPEQGGEG
jgi:hypothetical protein